MAEEYKKKKIDKEKDVEERMEDKERTDVPTPENLEDTSDNPSDSEQREWDDVDREHVTDAAPSVDDPTNDDQDASDATLLPTEDDDIDAISHLKAPQTSNKVAGAIDGISTDDPNATPEDESEKQEADQGLGTNSLEEEAALLNPNEKRSPASETMPLSPSASPLPGSKEYYSDLMARLHAAQNKSHTLQTLNDVGRALYGGATSFRGVQQNPNFQKVFDNGDIEAQQPIKQFEQELQIEGQDPQSPAAQAMRQAYTSAFKSLGIDPSILNNLNIDQMEKGTKFLGENANNKIKAQAALINSQNKAMQAATAAKKVEQQKPVLDSLIGRNNAQAKYLELKPGLEAQRNAALAQQKSKAADDKQKLNDEKEIAKASKELNGLSASSRSVIGNSERIKAAGQRLISIVDDPNATPEDMQSVYADMNAMISGNTTVSGQDHAAYKNLETSASKLIEYITSDTSAPNIPEVKEHLKSVSKKIMELSDKIQEKQLKRVLAGRKSVFDRNPEARQTLIDSLQEGSAAEGDATNSYNGSTSLPPNATPEQKAKRLRYLQSKAGQ